jgi:hypothetical protein
VARQAGSEPISCLLWTKNAHRSSSILISYNIYINFLDENAKSSFSLFFSVVRTPCVLKPLNILNSRLKINFDVVLSCETEFLCLVYRGSPIWGHCQERFGTKLVFSFCSTVLGI